MKKSFLLIACAVLSMSIFAQTPQAASTSKKTKPAEQSAQVKQDHSNTQHSKEALAQDKSKKKADKTNNASTQTKKADKKQVKADKATVKTSKKTEKKDKTTAKKTSAASSTGSVSGTPKQ